MKSILNHSMTRVTRFAVALLTAVLLTSSVGCGGHVDHVGEDAPLHEDEPKRSWPFFGGKEKVSQSDFESLEADFEDLRAQVTGDGKSFAGNVALWQAVAALFIVLAGFALVGGAALGSRARRERHQQQQQQAAVNLDGARS